MLTTVEQVDHDETQTVRHVVNLPNVWNRAGDTGMASVLLWNQPTINPTSWTVTAHAPAGWTFDPAASRTDIDINGRIAQWNRDPERTESLQFGLLQSPPG